MNTPPSGRAVRVGRLSPDRSPCQPGRPSVLEELADDPEKLVQAVMVQPVPRLVDADDGPVPKRRGAAVLGRVAGLALLPVQEKGRTVDPRPQVFYISTSHLLIG